MEARDKQQTKPSSWQLFSWHVSLAYNYALGRMGKKHHQAIVDPDNQNNKGGIYLGAIPIATAFGIKQSVFDDMLANPNLAVIQINEPWELDAEHRWPFTPVSKRDFESKGIQCENISIRDHRTDVDDDTYNGFTKAFEKINTQIASGHSIYIHCKAGRSRSVLFLMCYLMTAYQDPISKAPLNYDDAYRLIHKKRPHIDFKTTKKYNAVASFVRQYATNHPNTGIISPELKPNKPSFSKRHPILTGMLVGLAIGVILAGAAAAIFFTGFIGTAPVVVATKLALAPLFTYLAANIGVIGTTIVACAATVLSTSLLAGAISSMGVGLKMAWQVFSKRAPAKAEEKAPEILVVDAPQPDAGVPSYKSVTPPQPENSNGTPKPDNAFNCQEGKVSDFSLFAQTSGASNRHTDDDQPDQKAQISP